MSARLSSQSTCSGLSTGAPWRSQQSLRTSIGEAKRRARSWASRSMLLLGSEEQVGLISSLPSDRYSWWQRLLPSYREKSREAKDASEVELGEDRCELLPETILVTGVEEMWPNHMGAFKKVSVPGITLHGERPIYQNERGWYLFYWKPEQRWYIGASFTVAQGSLTSSTSADSPVCSWDVWTGSGWSSDLPVKVSEGRAPRATQPQRLLLWQQSLDRVRKFRTDTCTRFADRVEGLWTRACQASRRALSHPCAVGGAEALGRLLFLGGVTLTGVVAALLLREDNLILGGLLLACMALPYLIMTLALLRVASKKLAEMSGASHGACAVIWLATSVPLCCGADLYLNLRYLFREPQKVKQFHYMTLRRVVELFGAPWRLGLQICLCLKLPISFLCSSEGSELVDPLLLGCSMALCLVDMLSTGWAFGTYAEVHTGGSKLRFLLHLCSLGHGLAPSSLFSHFKHRTSVVIAYNLQNVCLREMSQLGMAARKARQLEELVFRDARWLGHGAGGAAALAPVLTAFLTAPGLRRLELRGAYVPEWAFERIVNIAKRHHCLEEVYVAGHGRFYGRSPPAKHPLLRAVHDRDPAAVELAEEAPRQVLSEALATAALSKSMELLRSVLLREGGLEALHDYAEARNGFDITPGLEVDSPMPLHLVASADDPRATELLITAMADVNCVTGKNAWTPLMVAARDGSERALAALLKARADVEKTSVSGCSPAYIAAQDDNAGCLRRLLAADADCNRRADDGVTPLWIAAQNNSLATLRALVQVRSDPNVARNTGATALYIATKMGSIECMRTLLEARAGVDLASNDGVTPLYVAAEMNFAECLRLLLSAKADLHAASKQGATPLHIASEKDSAESLMLLLRARADAMQPIAKLGLTPVALAAHWGSTRCLQLLLESRADPRAEWQGVLAVDRAQERGHETAVVMLNRAMAKA